MRKSLLILVFVISTMVSYATTFRANGNGNWGTASTWSPAGIPSNRDTVQINGLFTVTVNASATCAELSITGLGSTLTINPGVTLAVGSNFTMLVDDATDMSTVNLNGTMTVGGNLIMSYSDALALTSYNIFNAGSAASAGTLTVTGNVAFSAYGTSTLGGIRNTLRFYQGTVNVLGNIAFTASGSAGSSLSSLAVMDDGTADGKTKVINLSSSITGSSAGAVTLTDASANAPYTFRYVGSIQQNFVTTNVTYRNVEIANTNEVWLVNDVPNASLLGTFKIKNGAILNTRSYTMDNVTRVAGQISVENGGTYRTEIKTGIPAQKIGGVFVCQVATSGIVEYYAATGVSLDVLDEQFYYGILKLSGPGIKLMNSQDLDNTATFANRVDVTAGTFSITRTKKFILTNSLDKTCYVRSGAAVIINGDFAALDSYFSIDYNSTFTYNETGTQQVYSFTNSTGAIEPYGALTVMRAGLTLTNRNIAANNTVKVRGKLTVGANIKLNINQNAYLELMSDSSYTAYIAEIPATSSINYLGTPAGQVIAKKYIKLNDANYRDLASPIPSRTLATWQNGGLYMTGFTGSTFPNFPFVSAYQYDETNTLTLNDGFVGATNITNPLVTTNGSGNIVRGGWRIYTGETTGQTYTLADTGFVRTGSVTFTTSFTHGTGNRTTDDGWNFIGNPLPSAISWSLIYADAENTASFGSNGIKPTFYVWRPADTGTPYDEEDSYGFYNAVTGVSSFLSATIPSFQGFWVKTYHATASSATYNLKIKESHKVDQNASTFYKSEGESEAMKSLVKVSLKQGELGDDVWFHTFPGATTGVDETFDVERFGEVYDGPNLNFSSGNNGLNLWVNALPSKGKQIAFPLQVFIPADGEFTVSMSNVEGFTSTYGCLRLLDQMTGTIYAVMSDTTFTFTGTANYRDERFLIIADKNLSNMINVADATCFGNEDGVLAVNLEDYEDESNFTLVKDGSVFKTYTGNVPSINEALGKGQYKLINNTGLVDCTVNEFDFTINSYPEVLAAFESPAEFREDAYVPLHNSSVGATNYKWVFSDNGTVSMDKTPNYMFNEPGQYRISLVSVNEYGCESEEVAHDIDILSTSGVQDISKSDFRAFATAEGLQIVTPSDEDCEVAVYTVDGKQVMESRHVNGTETIQLDGRNVVYLVRINTSKGIFTTRILH